jgi:hypothetical protein
MLSYDCLFINYLKLISFVIFPPIRSEQYLSVWHSTLTDFQQYSHPKRYSHYLLLNPIFSLFTLTYYFFIVANNSTDQ